MASQADKEIVAAGVVLLKARGSDQICVLHRPTQKDWSLPKGKLDEGEHIVAAARRETIEETGCDVTLGVPLTTQRYKVEGRPKVVYYWVGRLKQGGPGFRPNKEIDDLEWVSPKGAAKRLSYPRDIALIRAGLKAPVTSPLIIVRHAQATRRASWGKKRDELRPLSDTGMRQAEAVSLVMQAYGVERIHTSNATRCVQTMRPFAKDAGITMQIEEMFSEEGFDEDKRPGLHRIAKLLRDPRPLAVCTHRPVLPGLIRQLAKSSRLSPKLSKLNPALPPGGFIVLHRRFHAKGGMRVVAIERHA